MPHASPSIPKYRLHKATGKAVVTLSGRDFYLGAHGSPDSKAEYERRIAEWLAAGRALREGPGAILTVAELVDQYLAHARGYYVKDGAPTSQLERVTRSLDIVLDLYDSTRARDFGPLRLKAVRQKMIEKGWVRRHINQCVGCVKLAFRWAVSEELVPPSVAEGLRSVAGLERGRCAATESDDVLPAPEDAIRAVQAIAAPQIRDLIELQLWTGARPGEVVILRPRDLDRSGCVNLGFGQIDVGRGVWVYRPATHKTQHHGHHRVLLLGPRAQDVLAPYLDRTDDAFCFSPAEANAWRFARKREQRQTPVQPSQVRRAAQRERAAAVRAKAPGDCYSVGSYAHAIKYAIRRTGCANWHAHQLRHNAATRLVSLFGWEVARIILGHRSVEMTRTYAADDLRKAADAMRAAG